MERSKAAQQQERQQMLAMLAKKGKCVDPNEDIYGWVNYQAETHIKDFSVDSKGDITTVVNCAWVIDPDAVIEESHISQFEDTFSGNREDSTISVYPVSCACGKYNEQTLRYVSDFGSIVRSLVEDF